MRDIVLVAVLVALVPLALARPWLGFLGYTLIGFWNPHKFTWQLQDVRIALMVGGATLLGLFLTRQRRGIPWNRELVLMLALAAYFTVTTQFAWAPEAASEQWDRVIRIYLMTFVMGTLIFGEQKIRALLWVLMLGIGLFGVKGGLFAIGSGGEHHVLGPETTFLEANTSLGLAFNMVLPLLFFAAQEQRVWWRKFGFYGAGLLTIIATVFTYSRGAWLGLAITVALLLLRMKRGILIAAVMVPMGVAALAFVPEKVFNRAETIQGYEQDNSAMTRIQAWSVAWNVALDHPLLGAGFDFESYSNPARWLAYADRKYDEVGQTPRAAHSIYFQVLGSHGFVAFGLFVALLAFTMLSYSDIRRKARNRPGLEWIAGYATALQTGLVGFLVSGAFLNLAYFDLFYLYVGLVPVFQREIRDYQLRLRTAKVASNASVSSSPISVSSAH